MLMNDYVDLSKPTMPPMAEYMHEVSSLWDNRRITNIGEKHNELEKQLGDYLEVPYLSLFVNGHSALECALHSLNLPGGEIITTPFTFASTLLSIIRCGFTPKFCDIKDSDFTLDSDKIEGLITDKTVAILPVHVFGNICDVDMIAKVSKMHNLRVVYDAAHAFGARKLGIGIGNFGDISMFSFHATKVFHTIEGGGLSYGDSSLMEYCARFRNFGLRDEESCIVGTNSKMSEFQAAMGLCNLRYIDSYIEKRKRLALLYSELLEPVQGVLTRQEQIDVESNYSYYPIRVIKEIAGFSRDGLLEKLAKNGIHARRYYYPLVSQYSILDKNNNPEATPIAETVSSEILVLPLYPDLGEDDVLRICRVISMSSAAI